MNTTAQQLELEPATHSDFQQRKQRIERLMGKLNPREYPICVEKARLVIASYKENEGRPQIIRKALA